MNSIKIDRKKVAAYFRDNASDLAQRADIEVNAEKVENGNGDVSFYYSIYIEIREIPVEALEQGNA